MRNTLKTPPSTKNYRDGWERIWNDEDTKPNKGKKGSRKARGRDREADTGGSTAKRPAGDTGGSL